MSAGPYCSLPLFLEVLMFLIVIMISITSADKPRIYIAAGGATLPVAVYKAWKPVYQAYRGQYAHVIMSYQARGSGEGVQRFEDKLYDYAGSDAPLSELEYRNDTSDFQMFPTMAGPISLSYNIPEMPTGCVDYTSINNPSCLNLTRDAIVGIFNGSIRNWSDPILTQYNSVLHNVKKPIMVVVRADKSGTTEIFTSALSAFNPNWKNVFGTFTEGCNIKGEPIKWNVTAICATKGRGASGLILNTPYSIGFMGSFDAEESLLPEARILNRANKWVGPSAEGIHAAMEYNAKRLGKRLTGSLIDSEARDAYPIAGYTYFLIRPKSMTNCTVAIELYRYIQFILEDSLAISIVLDMMSVPLNAIVIQKIQQQVLAQMECNGIKLSRLVEIAIAMEDGAYDAWKLPVAVVLSLVLVSLILAGTAIGYVTYIKYKSVINNTFILHLDTVDLHEKMSTKSMNSMTQSVAAENIADFGDGIDVLRLADGHTCLVRKLCPHLLGDTLTWSTRLQLVRLKENISHSNIVTVLGISVHGIAWKLVTSCPAKGPLKDILQLEKYKLDPVFRYSIAIDMVEGMSYLHKNGFLHGQLTSSCCYVNSRWGCVVGDWETYTLHTTQKMPFNAFEIAYREARTNRLKNAHSLHIYLTLLFWSAPEVLQYDSNGVYAITTADKQADVYSFGVVTYEIFTCMEPYEETLLGLPADKVLTAVIKDKVRPHIPDENVRSEPKIVALLRSVWQQEPSMRPTFLEIRKELKRANPYRSNIIDTMMESVEKYAKGLEEMVTERTAELERITRSMETLLHSMLPTSIADQLSRGQTVEPEFYEASTLCFTDIVGFTSIAAISTPLEIVTLLNDLYSAFDSVISRYDVYKVETIGDSYMCISGLPTRNGEAHVTEIATMTLDMLNIVTTIPVRHLENRELKVRIGAHSGSVMAGIVGMKMPRYCLFGDTVNMASRMESSSLPMRIQISDVTKLLLDPFQIYQTIFRGERLIKGKGLVLTYWLIGKDGYNKSLPNFDLNDDNELLKLLDESQIK